jgi:hypothetical protein
MAYFAVNRNRSLFKKISIDINLNGEIAEFLKAPGDNIAGIFIYKIFKM